jgi:hypothetical protein
MLHLDAILLGSHKLKQMFVYMLQTKNKQTYNFYLAIEVLDHVYVLVGKI